MEATTVFIVAVVCIVLLAFVGVVLESRINDLERRINDIEFRMRLK